MINDTEIKVNAFKSLMDFLGSVDAKRFISLIQRKLFDYAKWQRTL
jgi:hypothetical protein